MFVAEVGLNHLGDPDYALEYVEVLAATSVDAVTFQIREPAYYRQEDVDFKDLDCPVYLEIGKRLRAAGKKFGIALADPGRIDLCQEVGVDFYKVLSWDLKNEKFLTALLEETDGPLHVSTGTSGLEEIDAFVKAFGAYRGRIFLIHTQLSHSIDDVNLRAIGMMRHRFGVPVGFGNHCSHHVVIYGAAVLGASDLFVYVRGNRGVKHPDHEHAVPVADVDTFAVGVKQLVRALGTVEKREVSGNPIEDAYLAKGPT